MKTITRRTALFGLLGFALTLAPPLRATKQIVLQNATRSSVNAIAIYIDPNGVPVEQVSYVVKDADGNVIKTGTITLVLSAGTKTQLLSHVDSVVLPAIDAFEGL